MEEFLENEMREELEQNGLSGLINHIINCIFDVKGNFVYNNFACYMVIGMRIDNTGLIAHLNESSQKIMKFDRPFTQTSTDELAQILIEELKQYNNFDEKLLLIYCACVVFKDNSNSSYMPHIEDAINNLLRVDVPNSWKSFMKKYKIKNYL